MPEDRIYWIDNAKAIGIFFVVFAHLSLPKELVVYILSFHMPLFFFLSGLTFKQTENEYYLNFFQRKVRSIIVPYFIFSVITYIFWVFIRSKYGPDAKLNTDIFKPLIGIFYSNGIDGWMVHNIPLWFLTCLFVIENMFYPLSKYIRKKTYLVFVLIASSIIGYVGSLLEIVRLPWGINVAFTGISFLGLGYLLKGAKFKNINKITFPLIILILIVINILISNANPVVNMNLNSYGNYLLFWGGAISGITAYIILSILIPSNKLLAFIGRNTLIILALHLMTISFIKAIQVFVLKIPLEINNGSIFINFIYTISTILLLVPVIYIINNYVPFILGKSPKATKHTLNL